MNTSIIEQDTGVTTTGDALRVIARRIDDYDLPTPIGLTPGRYASRIKVQVVEQDWADWTNALTTWDGETTIPVGDTLHVHVRGTIERLPVELVTVRPAVA